MFATLWERLGAALYDPFLALGERRTMARLRGELLADAHGDVLEIGAGTGLNLEHYPTRLGRLVLAEPVGPMADRLARRTRARPDAEVVRAPAERLPFESASFDVVVSTLVLCTVTDVDQSLSEVARVLKPGGRLLFIEHVRAPGGRLARRQARWAGAWAAFAQGCRCDRDTLGAVRSRFGVPEPATATWDGMPSVVRPLVLGQAVPGTFLDSACAEPGAARPARDR
jgi:SAM-dependent methyltransferase